MLQRQMRGADAGAQASLIAVKTQNRFGCGAPEQRQLIFGEGSPKWRNGIIETCAHQRNHIHITFGEDDALGLASGSSARAPNATMRPRESEIGNITRL